MDVLEKMKVSGKVEIYDVETGELVLRKDNLIVNGGKEWLAGRIGGTPPGYITKMKVGDNGDDPLKETVDLGDTTLNNKDIVNNEVSVNPAGGSASGVDVVFTGTFPAGTGIGSAIGEWKEAGLFAADDTMLSRITFGIITKTSGTGLLVVWTITVN